jgi:glycosyltransferase involved in cell wall biosynthesis
MNKIKIHYVGFMNQSGYSQAAQDYLLALHRSGKYDIKLTIFGDKPSRRSVSDERYGIFMKMVKKEEDNDRIQMYHCIPNIQKRVKKLKKNIGFAVYETFGPPQSWVDILNTNDALIVPSQFNYKIFAHTSINKPMFYIPHCIDFEMYNEEVSPSREYDQFTFLFIGTWKTRKGYKHLIEAWFKEFTDKENVSLCIKTDKPKEAQKYIDNYKRANGINGGFAPIFLERKILDEKKMPGFIKSFDCLVIPTLGEGFNIPSIQAMALGVPVIVTDCGGCQEHSNIKTATLINPDGYIHHRQMDGIPQFNGKKWAFITTKEVQDKMRIVFDNYQDALEKSKYAREYVKNKFNYEKIENYFTEMVEQLYG